MADKKNNSMPREVKLTDDGYYTTDEGYKYIDLLDALSRSENWREYVNPEYEKKNKTSKKKKSVKQASGGKIGSGKMNCQGYGKARRP